MQRPNRLTQLKLPAIPLRLIAVPALAASVLIGGCSADKNRSDLVKQILDDRPVTTSTGGSTANTLDEYKHELGLRIQQVNSTKVYVGRPQALLRAVIVVDFVVDAQGSLVSSEFMRSNHDKAAEATAMSTLKITAPFPKPPPSLLHAGKVEMSESWLFNNDGKFQLRSVALQQMDR